MFRETHFLGYSLLWMVVTLHQWPYNMNKITSKLSPDCLYIFKSTCSFFFFFFYVKMKRLTDYLEVSNYDLKFKMSSEVSLVGGWLFFNTMTFIGLSLKFSQRKFDHSHQTTIEQFASPVKRQQSLCEMFIFFSLVNSLNFIYLFIYFFAIKMNIVYLSNLSSVWVHNQKIEEIVIILSFFSS